MKTAIATLALYAIIGLVFLAGPAKADGLGPLNCARVSSIPEGRVPAINHERAA